jgi:protein-L-isoaspartate(D-aspartate) O-methyltransferase
MKNNFSIQQKLMVEEQLIARGIKDKNVLDAFLKMPRHNFVPDDVQKAAYNDSPLPIGFGQTISQPYMVAAMTELLNLNKEHILLEIGTGSGYQAAIAAQLCKYVYTIERIAELAEFAKQNLEKTGIKNVEVIVDDGSEGYLGKAPYDRILYTAAAPFVPETIFKQLKNNGVLVVPEGERYSQVLKKYIKKGDNIESYLYFNCIFVPLKGKHGFQY